MSREYLNLAKYRFTLEATEPITLPTYKGSAFHGGFGHALMQISPIWYRYFFESGPGDKDDWPQPFVILPPLEETENYQPGEHFHCELTLFGEATQHYAIAQAAIEYLGMQMGLGYTHGKFHITEIKETVPQTSTTCAITKQITLRLPTRLRIKSGKQLYRNAPQFNVLIARLLGRIKTLQFAYSDQCLDDETCRHLLQQAKQIAIRHNGLQWDDWERFSGRQKKWMNFGGLMGNVSYAGELQPFMEYLELGQWLHIGGKTSFGLGKYELQTLEN